jgi:phosphomannomutase
VFAEMAAWCRDRGTTVLEYLENISRRFGVHATGQKSLTLPGSSGMERIASIMNGLRERPPQGIGEAPVRVLTDYQKRIRRDGKGSETAVDLPRSNVLAFDLEDGSRVLARPSGTEPKIKFYFEVSGKLEEKDDFAAAEAVQKDRLARLQSNFTKLVESLSG